MTLCEVVVAGYHGVPSSRLLLPSSTSFASLPSLICSSPGQSLCLFSGRSLPSEGSLDTDYVHLRLSVRLPGGKGGFGSQLRAAGGRMASQKTSNKDSCRTLDGRRLSTVKEAETLAEYIRTAPEREAKRKDEAQKKLKELKLQIERMEADSSMSGVNKRRLDDDDFNEKNEEMLEGVKDAVKAALLKRKKKKTAAATSTETPIASASGTKVDEVSAPAVVAAA